MRALEVVARAVLILWRERMFLYILLLALFVTGAVLGREWLVLERQAQTEERSALAELLGRRLEPSHSDEYPAIVSAALGLLSGATDGDECESSDPGQRPRACENAARMHEAALLLRNSLAEPAEQTRSARLDAALPQARRLLEHTTVEPLPDDYWERWSIEARRVVDPRYAPPLRFCADVHPSRAESNAAEHLSQFGDAGCDAYPENMHARLLVPSRLRLPPPIERGRRRMGAAPDPHPLYDATVSEEIRVSLLAEALVGPGAEIGWAKSGRRESTRLVQAYFVGAHGALRIWSDQTTDVPYSRLGPVRLWGESSSYFSPFLNSRSASAVGPTLPYVDYGSYGFVRTRCTAIRNDKSRLLGAFCTDRTIPLRGPSESTGNAPYLTVRGNIDLRGPDGPRVDLMDPARCQEVVSILPLPRPEQGLRRRLGTDPIWAAAEIHSRAGGASG